MSRSALKKRAQMVLLTKDEKIARGEMELIIKAKYSNHEELKDAKLRLAHLRHLYPAAWQDLPGELVVVELKVSR